MGNIPLCVPKKGPVVFTEGYDLLPGSSAIPVKQYYPYHTSLEDLSRADYGPELEAASQYYEESKRHSFFIGDDTAIVGLEIDQDSDQVYSGLLQFQYFNGNETETQNIHVKSSDTVANLIPTLRATFLKRSTEAAENGGDGGRHSYVALVQGEMERELDVMDKPLEIALDCSSKGLASPKFVFKSPLSEQTDTPLSSHQTNRFTSYVGALALGSGSDNEDSPAVAKRLTAPEFDQSSMNSFGSALSLSSKSSKTKSTSSLVIKSKKKKLTHTLSNQETGSTQQPDLPPEPSPHHYSSSNLNIDSPGTKRKANTRPKSIMSNFITRSLRVRKKNKQSTNTPTTIDTSSSYDRGRIASVSSEGCMSVNSLVSPLPAERRFTMSAVMHIYHMKPKQVQLYKSVLVSESSTTRQVITQALERYNMKLHNPLDFGLYEVIGKWQEICGTLPSKLSYQASPANIASSTLPAKSTSPLVNRHTSVEEFVVCYSRRLDMDECPYSTQYFLETKEGYTRRFELRKLSAEQDDNRKESTVSASLAEGASTANPNSPVRDVRSVSIPHMDRAPEGSPGIFGQTTHRKRARRNRAAADDATTSPSQDEPSNEDGVMRVQVTRPSSSEDDTTVGVSILTCSSPENEVPNPSEPSMGQPKNQMASLNRPFLLNLHIINPKREELIRFLTSDSTVIVTNKEATTNSESEIYFFSPDVAESTPVCAICRLPIADSTHFTITPKTESVSVSVNGHNILQSTKLLHGDIISIAGRHMLLFQNFSNHSQSGYNWEPRPVDSTLKLTSQTDQFRPSSQMSTSSTSTNEEGTTKLMIKSAALGSHSRSGSEISLTVEDVDSNIVTAIDTISISEGPAVHQNTSSKRPSIDGQSRQNAHTRLIMRQMLQTDSPDRDDQLVVSMPSTSEGCGNKDTSPGIFSSPAHTKPSLKQSTSLPPHTSPRKVMFSYSLNEEDALLSLLVDQFTSVDVTVPLGPAYALAMCTEYGMMCHGPKVMTGFIKKVICQIQNKAWECCKKLDKWQVDSENAKKPLLIMKELFVKVEAVLVLLANALEFYHFLTTSCDSLDLSDLSDSAPQKGSGSSGQDPDTLQNLHNVLVYTFQQSFYSISRVLFHALPVMLDGCTEDKLKDKTDQPIVIDQAVDFLQSLFDLLTRLHVHLEVTSQFFANIFFFTNAVMFNGLIEQGVELALYQHSSGQALRANLNLLEGWACQVGFRDCVLHYLAKFSGAVDLLATSPNQLLKMDWSILRRDYPMLHPAQLHYLLSSYLLPVSHQLPSHWTPPQNDAIHAVKTDALMESYDHHPSFELPTSGYTMDLTKPPHNMEQLQAYLDELRKQLKTHQRSVDIVPVTPETKPITTPYTNRDSSDTHHTDPQSKPYQKRTLLINDSPTRARRNIGSNTESQEDLLQDSRNTRNSKTFIIDDHKHSSSAPHQSNGEVVRQTRKYAKKRGREHIVERVHSIVGPRSFKTPEKFLLEPDDDSTWLEANFPLSAETVTIPRGDKGFGFIMVEKKEPGSTAPAIFVHEVLPGSMADTCSLVRGGDKILAIDGQLLDGADYIIADKYLKEAEDDVTLVILRNQR